MDECSSSTVNSTRTYASFSAELCISKPLRSDGFGLTLPVGPSDSNTVLLSDSHPVSGAQIRISVHSYYRLPTHPLGVETRLLPIPGTFIAKVPTAQEVESNAPCRIAIRLSSRLRELIEDIFYVELNSAWWKPMPRAVTS